MSDPSTTRKRASEQPTDEGSCKRRRLCFVEVREETTLPSQPEACDRLGRPCPRDEVAGTMQRIYGNKLTTTSGGNISVRAEDGSVWLTPKGTDKGDMLRNQIVHITTDNTWHSDIPELKPSTENPLHLRLYKNLPEVNAIIHAHSPYLVSFAITCKVPDTHAIASAYQVCGVPALCPYACPGTEELAQQILTAFRTPATCVIMQSHGIMTVGKSMAEAFERFETLEFCAGAIANATALHAPLQFLTDAQLEAYNHFTQAVSISMIPRCIGLGKRQIFPAELEARFQICKLASRAYKQRLTAPSSIVISSRTSPSMFVITPAHADANNIKPESLVAVSIDVSGHLGHRDRPCILPAAAAVHAHLYKLHEKVNAVITCAPACTMAFALASTKFEPCIIPESYILLRDLVTVPFQMAISPAELAKKFNDRVPMVLVRNDAVYSMGASLLQAFDRLEVMEAMAQALVLSTPLGKPAIMSKNELLEIEKRFF